MKPTTLKERYSLDEDMNINEEAPSTDSGMSDEDLKIESLKIATNIGKLMNNVTTDDIVKIAETVATFIKGGDSTSLEATTVNTEDTEDTEDDVDNTEEFTTEEPSTEESEETNESEDTEEEFEI